VNGSTIGCSDSLVRLDVTEHTWGVNSGVQDMRATEASHTGKDKYILDNRIEKMNEL
jgi:hypothetical protein